MKITYHNSSIMEVTQQTFDAWLFANQAYSSWNSTSMCVRLVYLINPTLTPPSAAVKNRVENPCSAISCVAMATKNIIKAMLVSIFVEYSVAF